MTKMRHLKGKGKYDYDYINDILFFKVKDREYVRSIEFSNMVFDIDLEDFIVGMQIFEASKFLHIPKMYLKDIPKWNCNFTIKNGIVEINLFFQVSMRNKIIEKNPIIQQPTELPNSQISIAVPA
ncbi:hypothetical protein COS83_00500 [archaeon CG07_land_8_20_14_0_80_38_8]|nr:MAG: hypothetical protein COS83_00500 [archaeon CG07_land_8_20_14_0_80_38_8]